MTGVKLDLLLSPTPYTKHSEPGSTSFCGDRVGFESSGLLTARRRHFSLEWPEERFFKTIV